VHSEWPGVKEGRWLRNSFTTLPNLTNLIVRTHKRLLAVTVGRRPSGLSDEDYLTYIDVGMQWCSWVRNCAACSIPVGVIKISHYFNSSSRAMACGWLSI
jgi:hypothetical protein